MSLSVSSAKSLKRFAIGGVEAEALVCLLLNVRERLGGASSSLNVGGERRLSGDPISVVGESMSDQRSGGASTRAIFALAVWSSVWAEVTLVTPLALCGVVFLAFTLYWPGCLVVHPLHLVFHFFSNGRVHDLQQSRHLALVHLPLCASMMSWPAKLRRAMCWLAVRTTFFGVRSTAGGFPLGRPREFC